MCRITTCKPTVAVQVEPEHLLLGMIGTCHSSGLYGWNIEFERAKREVQSALGGSQQRPSVPRDTALKPTDLGFSVASKKALEKAQMVCRVTEESCMQTLSQDTTPTNFMACRSQTSQA